MRLRSLLLLCLLAQSSLLRPSRAHASPQEVVVTEAPTPPAPAPGWKADPLFPGKRHGSIGLGSGVPFVAMGEIAYAPSDNFAIGGIVGATPFVLGLGVRPRLGIPLNERTRLSLVSTILYYPTGEGLIGDGPPWFLGQPSVRVERRLGEHGYVHAGVGLVAALGVPSKNENGEMVVTYGQKRFVSHELPWGVWNTVGAGGALSLTDKTLLFADAMLVMKGVTVPSEWIGGPPVACLLGVARSL